ncbi:hypothetical protein KW834_02305 [Pseudomonas sp. PDM29]|jgi:phenylacetate-CoA ligase|uniref:hypothetical protein n=1 Tax=unclassified Pseudomonas TaxID=196821 RepID=UPI001C47CF58|nr:MULTISPECIES: hypothetical protein [unclassified Pseudomonas]MBV7523247.1 hypothetical protein [Pseudomonas sp. PDM29]
MKETLKQLADKIPYPVGKLLGKTPMRFRLGEEYSFFSKELIRPASQLRKSQLSKISTLAKFAYDNTAFYKSKYNESNFAPIKLESFVEVSNIPIITKADLQKFKLDDRSVRSLALKKSNTGGTTGQPLDFYLEKNAYAREWAHIHAIWSKFGYHFTDEKITIRGKNIGNNFFKYNFNQNEFLINAYAPLGEHIDTCRDLILKRNIKWIHGYPSSVFSFLRELESTDSILFEILIHKVKGVFLGSEYPAPQYRNYIEKYCGLRSISWYGHSEMAILAPELEPGSGIYYPYHSYGYAEAVPEGNSYRLIGTSTHNFSSPLIRYDTGDLIEPTFKDGLLESFQIKEGRNSETVIDLKGREISLTGLIFGRHHKAFAHCEHIQVRQIEPGKIEILITSKESHDSWPELFDFSNSFFEFSFKKIDTPIRTALGKVRLLLRQE